MGVKTLEELKEENASTLEDEKDALQGTETEEEIVDEAELDTEEETEDADSEEESEEGEAELWMQSDEQTSQEDRKFTDSDVAAVRRKLKARATKAEDENADLKAQLAKLQKNQPAAQPPKRPRIEDFDHDEDAYNTAMDGYYDSRLDHKLSAHTQTQQQTQANAAIQRETEQAVNQHYDNAAKLVSTGVITADAYKNADELVRRSLDAVRPGSGDQTADAFISKLAKQGEGSEKVWFHLGKNPTALSTLTNHLSADPSGLDAMLYLGELKTKLTASPKKRVSRAPTPGSELKGGDGKTSAELKSLKRKYKDAVTANDLQARIDLKRKAKAAGHDPSKW